VREQAGRRPIASTATGSVVPGVQVCKKCRSSSRYVWGKGVKGVREGRQMEDIWQV